MKESYESFNTGCQNRWHGALRRLFAKNSILQPERRTFAEINLVGAKWLTGAMDLHRRSPKRRTFDAIDPAGLPTPAPVEAVL